MAIPKLPPPRDEYTPITDFRDLGETVGMLKREFKAVRVDTKESREGILELKEWRKHLDSRLNTLEKLSGHDCFQSAEISEMHTSSQELIIKATQFGVQISGIQSELEEIQGSRKAVMGILIGIVMTLLGSVGGWVWTLATMHADIDAVKVTNVSTQENITRVRQNQQEQSEQIVSIQAGIKTELLRSSGQRFADWWGELTPQEKIRIIKIVGSKGIP